MSYGDLKGWNKICQNDFNCSKCQFEGANHDKLKNVIWHLKFIFNSYNYNFMFNLVTLHENYGLPYLKDKKLAQFQERTLGIPRKI
jgi:hypothetical protein